MEILTIIKELNNNYANLLLFAVALLSLVYAYREYKIRQRAIVVPELHWEVKENTWYFNLVLANLGVYPAHVSVEKVLLTIGDENYPTEFKEAFFLPPSNSSSTKQVVLPIGSINELGRNKIKGHEYRKNRCELLVKLSSKTIGQKNFEFESNFLYEIDVNNDTPLFGLIKEEIN